MSYINTANLHSAVNSLQQFAFDMDSGNGVAYPAPTTQATDVFIQNYEQQANTPEQGWRPVNGSDLQSALYIIMDKIDGLERDYKSRIEQLEEELEEYKLDRNEEMLEIA